jgi:hypothetical protein
MPVATNSNLPLEAGIFVTFDDPTNCVRGDYWLIPARTVIRDVVWPRVPISSGNLTDPDQRTNPVEARRPFHAFAPLAKFTPSTTAGTPPIINEFFGRRQLATNAPIRLGTIAPNDLKSLINQIRALIADDALAGFIARLTKSVPITAQLAPAYLQAEDLNSSITTSGNLRALLGKMPHSVVEIETLTRQEWLDALTFKNGKPLENTDVTAATTVLADARKVCELFRAWPLGILTVEDCNLLKKGVSA